MAPELTVGSEGRTLTVGVTIISAIQTSLPRSGQIALPRAVYPLDGYAAQTHCLASVCEAQRRVTSNLGTGLSAVHRDTTVRGQPPSRLDRNSLDDIKLSSTRDGCRSGSQLSGTTDVELVCCDGS